MITNHFLKILLDLLESYKFQFNKGIELADKFAKKNSDNTISTHSSHKHIKVRKIILDKSTIVYCDWRNSHHILVTNKAKPDNAIKYFKTY